MGLLDDAIREHLDLKRRRGADPEEIERLEREALGPVRRGPEENAVLESPVDGPSVYEGETEWEEPFAEEGEYELAEEGEGEAEPFVEEHTRIMGRDRSLEEPESLPAEEQLGPPQQPPSEPAPPHDRQTEDELIERGPSRQSPPSAPPPAPARGAPPAGGEESSEETVEYDVEGALEEGEQGQEDVLEETPEFLQDTPDHDRLWFEQRPPRDFDMGD